MAKVGPKLIRLYHAHRQHQTQKGGGPFESRQPMMPVVDGQFVVIDAVAADDPAVLRRELEALGLRRGATAGRVVSGLLPIAALEEAARLPSLNNAAPSMMRRKPPPEELSIPSRRGDGKAPAPRRKIGETTTQGDVSLYADRARRRFGVTGAGVKVCALSTSYDNSEVAATTATDDILSGDLPGSGNSNGFTTPVEVLRESPEPSNDEGRAMLQIVHDIAPEATLGFLSPLGEAGFVQGIRQLADAGCEVITDDLTSYAQPMFQDGLVSQVIEEVGRERGVFYVNAAGNEADNSYAAAFSSSGRPASSVGASGEGTLHDFDPSAETDVRQHVKIPGLVQVFIGLQWDDPFFRVSGEPGADTDLDIYLLDGEEVLASSTRDNIGGDPWEILTYENRAERVLDLSLAISLSEGPQPGRLKYIVEQGARIVEHDTDSPTIFAHNDAASALSVGASAWFNTPRVPADAPLEGRDPPLLNGFSSKGGTPLLFNEDGHRLPEPVRRAKPDVTAPDGGNTTFFGIDAPPPVDTDGFPNFFGTSAASPHVAAVVALMRSVRPGLSPGQIETRLEQGAVDIKERIASGQPSPIPGGDGEDPFSGAGLIRADRAVRAVFSARVTGLQASGGLPGDGPTSPVVLRWGTTFEGGSKGFVVERRPGPLTNAVRQADGEWTRVGFVESKAVGGRSTDTLRYRFAGKVPTPGRHAFRLRHVTEDGPEKGRRIGAAAEIDVPIPGGVSVAGPQPNPSREGAELEVVVEQAQVIQIFLFDALGRRVQTIYDGFLGAKQPLILRTGEDLSSGTYFLRVNGENFAETRRMIVVR